LNIGTAKSPPDVLGRDFGYAAQMKKYWLVKQEPGTYSWSDFQKERGTSWTGVRNYTARNNLRQMQKGDQVLFYHSGEEKAVVGLAQVKRPAYADATATEGDWSTVDLVPVRALKRPVSLSEIKSTQSLQKMPLIRQSRLSVMPVTESEFHKILQMGGG
jgi:predicted RNA-binding protein with PUA-like domain